VTHNLRVQDTIAAQCGSNALVEHHLVDTQLCCISRCFCTIERRACSNVRIGWEEGPEPARSSENFSKQKYGRHNHVIVLDFGALGRTSLEIVS
jgi:hypothetical protein